MIGEVLRVFGINASDALKDADLPGKNETSSNSWVEGILGNAVDWVFILLGTIGVIMLIYGGIQLMTSNGDSGKAQRARQTITYSVVGIIVVLAAGAITNFVIGAFS